MKPGYLTSLLGIGLFSINSMAKSELEMIRVSDSEIAGSEVSTSIDGGQALEGVLNTRGELVLTQVNCA